MMCIHKALGPLWMEPSTRSGERFRSRTGTSESGQCDPPGNRRLKMSRSQQGFTLIELIVVVTIIGVLSTIAVSSYRDSVRKAKEAVLKEDLYLFESVIDQYFADKGHYPQGLDDLVNDGYIRRIPVDPFTGSASSWEPVYAVERPGEFGSNGGGIWDVRSGSDEQGVDGSYYNEW